MLIHPLLSAMAGDHCHGMDRALPASPCEADRAVEMIQTLAVRSSPEESFSNSSVCTYPGVLVKIWMIQEFCDEA